MVKIAIVGHRRRLDEALRLLQQLAVLHVVDFSLAPELGARPMTMSSEHSRELEGLRTRRNHIETLLSLLPADGADEQQSAEEASADPALAVDELVPQVERLAQRIAELEAEERALPRHLASLRRLEPLASELVESESYETVALLVDRAHAGVLEALREEIEPLVEHRFEMMSGIVERDTVGALMVFPRSASARVHEILGGGKVSRVRLPEEFRGLSFRESLQRMNARLDEIPQQIEALREQIRALVPDAGPLRRAEHVAAARIAQLELVRRFGGSQHAFVVVGWLPQRDVAELEARLLEHVGDEVVVAVLASQQDEEPPVLLDNPARLRPYQRLVELFGLPKTGAIDPSGLMSVFMPLFFGMMLGDVGYGLVLLVLSFVLGRRFRHHPVARDVTRYLVLASCWTVIWGAMFGELFGDLGHRWLHIRPLWLSRGDAKAIGPLLLFAIAVGAAHITLGLLLGMLSAWRRRQKSELVERVGLLVGLSGLFTLVGVVAEQLPRGLMTPSIAAFVVGIVLVGATKGSLGLLMGPLEIVSGVGNVLSYLRIAAIGMASAYLAHVANHMAVVAPAVLGVVVAVLLHALNLALGVFSPTIQALRLHYVEFFGKFYDEGGTPYQPFGHSGDGGASSGAAASAMSPQ